MAKKSKGLIVDFTDVKDGGGGGNKRIKASTYPGVIKKYEVKPSQAGNTMIVLSWVIEGGKYDGTKMIDRLTLTDASAWRAYRLLEAMGKKPPKKKMKLDPSGWVGERVGLDVEDDTYETNSGKTVKTSKVGGYVPIGDVDDDDDKPKKKKSKKAKEEEPAPKKGKKKGKGKKAKDDDELDEVDLDEL